MLMSLVNEKVILTFALDAEEIDILNNHFEKEASKPCIIINNSMGDNTLKEILEEKDPSQGEKIEALPLEKVIIFNEFQDGNLQKAVTDVRRILESRPILAAVTPISINMKFKEILEHLIEEREFHKKNSMKKN
jgi:Domain of unknown function (DUF3783)